jgi:hypothetical protein
MIPHARVTSRGVLPRAPDRGEDVTEDINRLEAFPPRLDDRRDPHAADAQDVDAA